MDPVDPDPQHCRKVRSLLCVLYIYGAVMGGGTKTWLRRNAVQLGCFEGGNNSSQQSLALVDPLPRPSPPPPRHDMRKIFVSRLPTDLCSKGYITRTTTSPDTVKWLTNLSIALCRSNSVWNMPKNVAYRPGNMVHNHTADGGGSAEKSQECHRYLPIVLL